MQVQLVWLFRRPIIVPFTTMFNLLPLQAQKAIKRQYQINRAIIFLYFCFASIFIALVFLVPSYLFSAAKEKEVNGLLEATKKTTGGQEKRDLSLVLGEINQKIQILKTDKRASVAEILQAIILHKSPSIKIIRLVFSQSTASDAGVYITGVAADRSALVSFAGELKLDAHFQDAILPTGDLAKDKDIDFSINLPVKQ